MNKDFTHTQHTEGVRYKERIFWTLDNGHVKCDECEELWCSHIQTALEDNADAKVIWSYSEEYLYLHTMLAMIPIAPKNGVWAPVRLSLIENAAMPTYSVTYLDIDREDESDFIGYIHQGEGRMIIRSMLIDWFKGQRFAAPRRCKATGHSYRQEMIYRDHQKSDWWAFVEDWIIWQTGLCLSCSTTTDQDFSDLVPEPEERKWPKPKGSYVTGGFVPSPPTEVSGTGYPKFRSSLITEYLNRRDYLNGR